MRVAFVSMWTPFHDRTNARTDRPSGDGEDGSASGGGEDGAASGAGEEPVAAGAADERRDSAATANPEGSVAARDAKADAGTGVAADSGTTDAETEEGSASDSGAIDPAVGHLPADSTRRTPERAAERIRRTAELLAERGHEVAVLCSQWWDGEPDEFERGGVTYRAVTESPAPHLFPAKLPLALRTVGPEVIHAANVPPGGAVAATVAGRLLRVPVVVDWWAGGDRRTDDWAARRADAVTVPSRMVGTEVRERGAAEEDVRVVPESIDFSLVREAGVEDRADLVYARDLDENSNVETFLLALAEIDDRDWRAAVVGDGPLRRDAERTARDLEIDDRVEFTGELPERERVELLKGAHVFAQTAYREVFATDLLWAMACGCVGIVEYQADSSAHELVKECDRGVRVTSPAELAEEFVAAMGREHATINETYERFDHRPVLERYLQCYRDLLAERGRL